MFAKTSVRVRWISLITILLYICLYLYLTITETNGTKEQYTILNIIHYDKYTS